MTDTPPLKHAAALKLRAAALAYPETVEDFPWGHSAFKVRGKKAFCFLAGAEDGGFSATMKLPFRSADALAHSFAEPTGYGLGNSGWVTCRFAAKDKPPVARLVDWLDESWRAVAPKGLSKTVPAPDGAEV